ncbi:iron chelate uptake ABC transporter family permease subunit [Aeromicrobium sp. 636]|uniref:Metal ABC transporter permease n=1 Tax=Aeromicrobium senzhongii TaxID=2663859 RepID=A0A8I0K1Z6_9ACTN|nr:MULTISPECIES: metal ABC transporter permease [Aeromicrobium]MBC9225160.1 metal ABC transporter permease [Aeromicrobium senzhongii]MCQ3997270.1 iron chelate uptake ABC transporter family permease subunit [Aeromicrobium sp. 636]MTB87202.1 iron chelate uptake ABC transporter family permease subunit [Aeromicrobium senzhongii]QNL95722.1 metal ABC transporter permease [Aeromicrobium senzhongii]
MSVLSYPFMQYALAAAIITGLSAPAVGTFIVQRRLALLGDGLGHVALTGVALGMLTGVAPLTTAIIVAVAGAILLEVLRSVGRTSGDLALAMLFYGGIAGGVLLANLADESAAALNQYLFGSIITMSPTDLTIVAVLGLVVVVTTIALRPQLFALCQDEAQARVMGIPVRLYGMLIAVLAAVTITVAMRTVGLLLVSALMVVPVAAAQQVTRSFRSTHLAAMAIGLFSAVAGLLASYQIDTQPGPTIVVIALAVFIVTALVHALSHIRTRQEAPRG